MNNSTPKPNMTSQAGFSTLEILLAMAILMLTLFGAVLTVANSGGTGISASLSGAQSLWADSRTNSEALRIAQEKIEKVQAEARSDYNLVSSSSEIINRGIDYNATTTISDATQCAAKITTTVTWPEEHGRNGNVSLTGRITNIPLMLAKGGNCDSNAPKFCGWNPPATWASENFNPGIPTSLDVLNGLVYMTSNHAPYFYIADTNGAPFHATSGLFANTGSFNAGGQLNDVKVARLSDGNTYAFVARDSTIDQFQVIRVSDIHNPATVGTYQLQNVSSTGSYPQAWRVFYFDQKVYVTTRETDGPELHIFDVSNPTTTGIHELGAGKELNTTVNNFVVDKKNIAGVTHYFLYAATSSDSKELLVLDVTDPAAVTPLSGASRNLTNPDYADGNAVFLVGNKLYFGRESSADADVYVFDTTNNPLAVTGGLPILGQQDIGASVTGIFVSGPYLFISTALTHEEFQVWSAGPSPITKVSTTSYNFPNIINNGIKYENNWIYVSSRANDALRILYNNATSCP